MGTWGTGAFDDDAAADWADELHGGADLEVVRSALGIAETDYLEAPEGAVAIAAAEVVAAMLLPAASDLPADVEAWVAEHRGEAGREDALLALAAVDRVLADGSELKELWAESSDRSWSLAVDALRRRLQTSLGDIVTG